MVETHLKKPQVSESEKLDRISSLHDSILHHIISFLPPKEILKTIILSKRWKILLKSLPDINFEELERDKVESFTNFIDNFLHHHDKVGIRRFRLKVEDNAYIDDEAHVNSWINTAVSAGVQMLSLHVQNVWFRALPSCLFTCNSLVELTLSPDPMRFPEFFCFPKLKIMRLHRIRAHTSFINQLLKSPNLIELCLEAFSFYGVRSSPNKYTGEEVVKVEDKDDDSRTFSNLKKAYVTYLVVTNDSINDACKLVRQLSNAENLFLRYCHIEILHCEGNLFKHMSTFCNLKRLKITLKTDDDDGELEVGALACLLHLSSRLQSLGITFDCSGWMPFRRTCNRPAREYPPLCVPPCLNSIEMNYFQGSNNQIELVRFFLGNAKVLKKMTVRFEKHSQRVNKYGDSLRQELLSLPRLSARSVLHFSYRSSWVI